MTYLIVFFGAGLGGALRHFVNLLAPGGGSSGFPFATFAVNVLGSFAMGALAGYWLARGGSDQHLRLFLTTGVLGGFTTFSAFSLDTVLLIQRNAYGEAAIYAGSSVVLSVLALFLAFSLFAGSVHAPG
ncbi:fluoride efflux transporter CrcB [Sphingomonas sinipercae]|uniref:Fluoride-specific ion channel FluC n=1 Tax=Sphingomonas sinipercae TaxID=2714944 RepID=A0A6G7ZNM4_9SPHN|nr:fluoride efflux transporter CrcB [Sphingomonas sinipercae]QIL02584.1 fluoride efflux transporter CrcB [Sphingomonas sinipercae]